MCWCNSNLRTICCGGIDCYPKESSTVSNETIIKNSQLALWQSYTDKKQECEMLRDKLKLTLDMLEYSHVTSEVYYDYEKVSEFISDMNKFLEE